MSSADPVPPPKSDFIDDGFTEDEDEDEVCFIDLGDDLEEVAYVFLSIESVKLKINDKAKGPKQIYGEIKIRACRKGNCKYIYRRHGHEAEAVPEDDEDEDGFALTLCGPNCCLDPNDAREIKVLLYEKGPQPFFFTEFGLTSSVNQSETQGPICLRFDLPDDGGVLYVRCTWVFGSIPARFQFLLINDGEAEVGGDATSKQRGDLSVWGSIKAKHILRDGMQPNLITIFKARYGPITVPSGEPIPLPRSIFIVPVQSEGFNPQAGYIAGFLEIDVNLQAVRQDAGISDKEILSIKGKTKIFLLEADKLEQPRFFNMEDTNLKRKEPGRGIDGLQLKISVTPFHEFYPDGEIDYLDHA